MTEPELVDLSRLRPGPIRHESLPPKLLEMVKAVYDVIGQYLGMTLEQFEIGFMRDMHPERELAVWVRITKGWLAYHEKFLGDEPLPDEDEKKLLAALIAISAGVEDVSQLNLPVEIGRRLLECFNDPAKECSGTRAPTMGLKRLTQSGSARFPNWRLRPTPPSSICPPCGGRSAN